MGVSIEQNNPAAVDDQDSRSHTEAMRDTCGG